MSKDRTELELELMSIDRTELEEVLMSLDRTELIAMAFMLGVFKTPEEVYNVYFYNGKHLYTLESLRALYNEVMKE